MPETQPAAYHVNLETFFHMQELKVLGFVAGAPRERSLSQARLPARHAQKTKKIFWNAKAALLDTLPLLALLQLTNAIHVQLEQLLMDTMNVMNVHLEVSVVKQCRRDVHNVRLVPHLKKSLDQQNVFHVHQGNTED
ncbi:unnamed protein product [Agarophyton chilense]